MTSVFLTGATGYIGGEILYQLLTHGGYNVTALVRTDAKAQLLSEKTNGEVKTVVGCLDDLDTISTQVDAADVVINTANVDHVPSAEVFAKALAKKTKKTIFIHTSGTSVVGDPLSSTKGPSTVVYSDVKSIDEINSLADEKPHRPVDKIVLDIEEQNANVKTVIVCPSTIFGKSRGYDNLFSSQIPLLAALSKKHGKAFTVYLGDYIWSHVHIHDLGDLYYLILERLIADESIPTSKKGYYFGSYTDSSAITNSPSEIEHSWKGVAIQIGKILKEKGEIETNEVEQLSPDEINTFSGYLFAPYYWGTNSRTRGDNGVKIGWKPKYASSSMFWDSLEADVDHALTK
ncbi:CIC11C00000000014 [Sungouiella intermedia]|uniref:CIC11C00000000014 n=1 Tax=Sungouiella intermedia TaxID=45354 RepID=A0A1L0D190_9ASCO|nr:CIC11C00000000014 [[Candida] intermedia]